jgi:GNAT superfamily N-acetyltransferase
MENITVEKPKPSDLTKIRRILAQWTDETEVDKYAKRIENEIAGKVEFNAHYWLAKESGVPMGISGLSDPLPKIVSMARTDRPGELRILYVDAKRNGRGIGKKLVEFLEGEARKEGYTEIMARSAERYRDTAYDFYEKMGYNKVGTVYAGENRSKPMQVFRKEL